MARRIEVSYDNFVKTFSFDLPLNDKDYQEFIDLVDDFRGENVKIRTVDDNQVTPNKEEERV